MKTDDAIVSFRGVRKTYDGETLVVKALDLDIRRGEFLTLLGPSGSGKTTCLMMLAGFEFPTGGEIRLDGELLNNVPPHKRNIGMVFQNYALFPHLSVEQNVDYPLNVRRMPPRNAPRASRRRWRWCRWSASRSAIRRNSRAGSSSASRSRAHSCSSRSSC